MAIPSYTTDLTTIATGDLNVDTGVWSESGDAGWDTGGAMVDDQNLYYNNTECVSAQLTKDSNGTGASGPATIVYTHGTNITIPTDGAALIHHLWAAPPALNTLANGGVKVLAGSDNANFYAWNVSGSDFAPAPRGGWWNYAINPVIGTPSDTVGTAPATYAMIGMAVAALAQARGNPHACNAVRYGRCEAIFTGGEAADYATFAGYGAVDNAATARWNLIEPIGTSAFIMQGLQSLGTAATAVDFRDSNKAISIKNTTAVTANFNRMEVNNVGSNIDWTNISITALGTTSKWDFEVIDDAPVAKKSCTFTDIGKTTYQSNSTLTNTTYRRAELITQGGGTFIGCIADTPFGPIGMSADNLNLITGGTFNSDGTGHAVDLGIISSTQAVTWDNTDTGYAATNGATGNETIVVSVNTGISLTINVSATGSTPTIKNDGVGTVTIVAGAVTVQVKAIDSAGADIESANVMIRAADATGPFPYQESVTITSSGTVATVTHTGHGLASGDKVDISGVTNGANYNGAKQITVTDANTYTYVLAAIQASPATGTIISTFIALEGLTDAAGIVSTSRTYASDQPITGWVRKSTASPFYKQAGINNTITSGGGLSAFALLILDE